MASVSQMFDSLNQITVDAIIEPKENGERELAAFHFLKLMPKDLILLDRGYPAYWLFNLIISRGADFCPPKVKDVIPFLFLRSSEVLCKLISEWLSTDPLT